MPVFETIDQLREHRKVSQPVQDIAVIEHAADHIEQLLTRTTNK